MKLATFGMRGVAVALLWNRSLECEKKSDWESVRTIGEQITLLEHTYYDLGFRRLETGLQCQRPAR